MSFQLSSPVSVSRVVILGGTGFIGSHLIRILETENIPVVAFSSKDIDLTANGAALELASRISKEDTIIFISALTPDRGRDRATFMKNLTMADSVCSALEASSCRHLIYLSSDAVYSDSISFVREDSEISPSSYHGAMHAAREKLIELCASQLKIPLLLMRPVAVFGYGDTHNSYGPNRFLRSALKGEDVVLFGEGEELRDHIWIADLCKLLSLCVSREATGVLNAATGKSTTFYEVASQAVRLGISGVTIKTSQRTSPIAHKHFDTSELLKSMPNFQFTEFNVALGLSK